MLSGTRVLNSRCLSLKTSSRLPFFLSSSTLLTPLFNTSNTPSTLLQDAIHLHCRYSLRWTIRRPRSKFVIFSLSHHSIPSPRVNLDQQHSSPRTIELFNVLVYETRVEVSYHSDSPSHSTSTQPTFSAHSTRQTSSSTRSSSFHIFISYEIKTVESSTL